MNKFYFIKTFGCQMNFNDSLKIDNILKQKGYKKTNCLKFCSIILINTCSVRDNCHNSLYKYLIKIYKTYKDLLFIITGCISNFLSNFLLSKFNFIKIILGFQVFFYIHKLIKLYYYYKCKQVIIIFIKNNLFNRYNKISLNTNFITIIEGCNKYCSYCIVPYTRGQENSFYLNTVLFKILKLNKNYKSIYLLGQNVNSYVSQINYYYFKVVKFFNLINYIAQIYNILYINFITSHPKDFNKNIIKLYKLNKKLNNWLHLPIQSCSNKLLYLMRREYKLINVKNILYCIKSIVKDIYISTDLIIGFCYENNCDFYKTLVFIEKFLFDKSYIYIYSPRPYTKSYYFNNDISCNIINKRFNIINYKIKSNIYYINKMLINKFINIFIKNYFFYSNNIFLALMNNRVIYFKLKINLNCFYILRKFLKVKIINNFDNIFYGKS